MCVQLTGNFDSSEERKMIVMDVNPSVGTDLDDDRYYSDDLLGVLLVIQL